jgi:hypothetical protein
LNSFRCLGVEPFVERLIGSKAKGRPANENPRRQSHS